MPVHNSDIAEIFNQTADLLEIKGENQFRIRAYRNAARTINSLSQSAAEMIQNGESLSELPGIGKDLAGKAESVVKGGSFKLLNDLKKEIPSELTELMKISNLGAKRVAQLYKTLDIKSLKDLKEAVEEGKIRQLDGFGKKMEQQIAEAVRRFESRGPERMKLAQAEDIIKPFYEYLKKSEGVKDITIAGSFRRKKETVGDIDILATCKKGSKVMDRFVDYEEVEKVVSKGSSKSTVMLKSGLQIDLRVTAQVSYGSALVYFTGSKEHNIAIRKIAVGKKYKINEYGVFRKDERIAGRTEKQVYDSIGLKWVPPELRENRGEVEAAKGRNALLKLVEGYDIKGDLHCHSNYTDGRYSIKEMAEAAKKMGYEYMAMTDHSQKVTVAGGLNEKQLRKQLEEIDKLNDIHCKAAKEAGVKIAISTDSHLTGDLENIRFGIYQARRGGLEKKDVINTHSLSGLQKLLSAQK